MTTLSYGEVLVREVPAWLARTRGGAFLRAIGDVLDLVLRRADQLVATA